MTAIILPIEQAASGPTAPDPDVSSQDTGLRSFFNGDRWADVKMVNGDYVIGLGRKPHFWPVEWHRVPNKTRASDIAHRWVYGRPDFTVVSVEG